MDQLNEQQLKSYELNPEVQFKSHAYFVLFTKTRTFIHTYKHRLT